jgi:hypothetical protein
MSYKSVMLYRNRRADVYLVQPMTRHPMGASVECGEPTLVAEAEFAGRIMPALLASLEDYGRQPFSPELGPKLSAREYAKFRREHEGVLVTLHDTGLLDVTPLRRESGGYVGAVEDKESLNFKDASAMLADAVRRAFGRAV